MTDPVICPRRGAAFFMPLRGAGTVPSTGIRYGPALQRTASRCARGTNDSMPMNNFRRGNPQARQQLAQAAYQAALNPDYSWDAIAGRFDNLFAELAQQLGAIA